MSVIRVNYLTNFDNGDDVVLLTMDRAGVHEFQAALREAAQDGDSRLEHAGVVHEFHIEPDAADIELQPTHVVWRVDHARATEVIEDLASLGEGEHRACHQYVDDMRTPAEVLILSRDEYVDVIYPWQQPS